MNIKKFFLKQSRAKKIIIVFLFLLLVFYCWQVIRVSGYILSVKKEIPNLETSLKEKNIEKSNLILNDFAKKIDKSRSSIKFLFPLNYVPIVKNEINAFDNLLLAGKINLSSAQKFLNWANEINLEGGAISFDSFEDEQKKEILNKIASSQNLWTEIGNGLEKGNNLISQARQESNLLFVSNRLDSLAKQFLDAQELFVQIRPWLAFLPKAFGADIEKNYLLLLQNNTELRPSGGFIGTYGILTLKDGSIVNFETDNVYNLDEPAKAYNTKVPPSPLQKYIRQSQWFFRDVNWDPDFPTTAENAIQFYHDENGPIQDFAGVIAFTPRLIEEFLDITGPVIIDGNEFNKENIVPELQYHVELGFRQEGINIYNRKKIIDDLAQALKEKLFSLGLSDLKNFAPKIAALLKEKHLMFYFTDADQQKLIEPNNWSNAILDHDLDYFYVVDANLGSLKTDPAMKRSIDYVLREKDNEFLARVSITYKHTADFDWKTTRYRTYTRLYVPYGSKFVNSQGAEEKITITSEHNKTVFGTFISIEPLEEETLTFEYVLPQYISEKIMNGDYTLLVQKQGGADIYDLSYSVDTENISLFGKTKLNQDKIILN